MKCRHCDRAYSDYGLGLVEILSDADDPPVVCIECARFVSRNWFPLTMPSIFEMVDRIPWVPTQSELQMWKLWNIDRHFENRA